MIIHVGDNIHNIQLNSRFKFKYVLFAFLHLFELFKSYKTYLKFTFSALSITVLVPVLAYYNFKVLVLVLKYNVKTLYLYLYMYLSLPSVLVLVFKYKCCVLAPSLLGTFTHYVGNIYTCTYTQFQRRAKVEFERQWLTTCT